jgi:hypothetical protein
MAVPGENHSKPINTYCGHNAELLTVKASSDTVTYGPWWINSALSTAEFIWHQFKNERMLMYGEIKIQTAVIYFNIYQLNVNDSYARS